MLTFLRKIRRAMIDSGSTRKYFLYAMGEILLVMVGILLALQVNNWNENQKQKTLEIQYLNRLAEDLASDSSYYRHRLEGSQKVVRNHKQTIRMIYQE